MTAAGSKFRSTSVRFGMEFMRFCCKLWFMFCGEFIMFCGEFMRLCGEFMMLDAEFRMFCWCWGELELFELLPPFCMSLAGGTEGGPPGVIGLWPPLGVCGVCGVCGIWKESKVRKAQAPGGSEPYLIVQRFFHRVQRIQRIDGVIEVRQRVVDAAVASVHIKVTIHARRVFDGVAVWIELLISLVAVTAASENSNWATNREESKCKSFTFAPSCFH